MLEIGNRSNVFYWQTDRNLTVEGYDKFYLKRNEVSTDTLVNILQNGIKSIPGKKDISIISPDDNVTKGNVNIVRKITINNNLYIARMHPQGIKNRYFFVEQSALDTVQNTIPAPKILEVHETNGETDMDFVLMSASNGITMENAIKANPQLEPQLLVEAGQLMAKLHQIKVEKFGSFDNEIAKKENKLIGLHNSYKEFIWCGLEENIKRLLDFKVIDEITAEKCLNFYKQNNFEPLDGPRLIHNDFADWNNLVDKENISAILDWDECHAGDPIADLACWSTFYNIARFEKIKEGYNSITKLPEDFDKRFEYYRLRYTISKMALRVKRAQVDHSDFLKDKIKVGTEALRLSTCNL